MEERKVNPVDEKQTQVDVKKPLTEEQLLKLSKIKKQIKRIKRDNKLYFRDASNSARRLDKVSENLFDLIMVKFIQQDGESLYAALNKAVKHWSALKPIQQVISKQYAADFYALLKASGQKDKVEIFYNGTWKPLVVLELESTKVDKAPVDTQDEDTSKA